MTEPMTDERQEEIQTWAMGLKSMDAINMVSDMFTELDRLTGELEQAQAACAELQLLRVWWPGCDILSCPPGFLDNIKTIHDDFEDKYAVHRGSHRCWPDEEGVVCLSLDHPAGPDEWHQMEFVRWEPNNDADEQGLPAGARLGQPLLDRLKQAEADRDEAQAACAAMLDNFRTWAANLMPPRHMEAAVKFIKGTGIQRDGQAILDRLAAKDAEIDRLRRELDAVIAVVEDDVLLARFARHPGTVAGDVYKYNAELRKVVKAAKEN